MHSVRQTHRRLRLLLVQQMPRGQRRAQPERARRQQHVLDRRIDRCARPARRLRRPLVDTGDDPHRRLVEVVGQVLHRRMLPRVAFRAHAGRRRALGVAWPHHLVERLLMRGLHQASLIFASLSHEEAPALRVATSVRRTGTRLQASRINSSGTGSGLSRRIERVVCMIWNRSSMAASSSWFAPP